MEVKQGYKQTEVGVIPEDWDALSIIEVAKITTGGSDTQDKINDGEFPFFVRSQNVERINQYTMDCEAILTSGDGVGVGKIFHYVNAKFDFHQRVYCLYDFNQKTTGKYLFYQFSTSFYNRVMQLTAKSSVDSVRREMIAEMKLPFPKKISEQKAIANALSDMDALISQTEKLIEKKKAIKQGAMQELLKPKDGWVTKKLGDIGKTYGGLSGKSKVDFANGNAFYIPFMNVMSSPTINLNFFDSVYIRAGEKQNKAQVADLFFNGSSETPEEVGMCSVLTKQIDNLYLNSFCFGYRLNDTQTYNGLFLAYYFRSDFGRAAIFSLAQGATRYNLSKGNFLKMEIPIPEFQTQNEIAGCIADMDSELKKITIKLTKLKQQKQGMMQALLTGKIRLIS
jgi:type I restriction enzyme S subunit